MGRIALRNITPGMPSGATDPGCVEGDEITR